MQRTLGFHSIYQGIFDRTLAIQLHIFCLRNGVNPKDEQSSITFVSRMSRLEYRKRVEPGVVQLNGIQCQAEHL